MLVRNAGSWPYLRKKQIRIYGDEILDIAMLVFMCIEVEEIEVLRGFKGFVQGHHIDYNQAVSRTQTSHTQSRALTTPGSLIYRNHNFCRIITLSFI